MKESFICKSNKFICLFYLLFLNISLDAQISTENFLIEEILTKYSSGIVEGKFDTDFKLKTSSSKDTLVIKGLCQFNRNFLNKDSIASFVFFQDKMPSLLLFDNWMYEVWLNDSTYSKTKHMGLHESRKGYRAKAIFWDYLKSNYSFEKTQMPTSKLSINFNGILCLSETLFYEVGIADRIVNSMCYDSVDFAIYRFSESVSNKELYNFNQFSEWNLSKISSPMNTIGFENYIYWIESNFKKRDTTVKTPKTVQIESLSKIIEENSMVSLSGDTLLDQKMEQRFLLIDFWYSTCFPCLKSIPNLNKLNTEYSNKLKVVGVNSRKQDFDMIQNLISKFSIQYEIVLDSTSFWSDSFGVDVFPTIFLYDTILNKIVYTEVGYKEDLFESIQKIIE